MAKIYLSSTFEDLQNQRQAVAKALRELLHDVRAMENYVASGHRPVDVCLADVDWCEIYVGIFAWRYGYVPEENNPDQRSITEMEYQRALSQGKPCLIFLLSDQAPWLPAMMDSVTRENESGVRIKRLRKALSTRHTCSFFSGIDELARLVNASIVKALRSNLSDDIKKERTDLADESRRRLKERGQRVVGTRVTDVGELFRNRKSHRRKLAELLAEEGTRIVSVLGRAGIGKTALVARVLALLEQGRWGTDGQAPAIDGFIYLSSRTGSLSLQSLYQSCTMMLGGRKAQKLRHAWQDTRLSVADRIGRLLRILEGGVYIILMDHVDEILDERIRIRDPELKVFFEQLAASARGVKLVVTSREPITMKPGLDRFNQQIHVSVGLPVEDGCTLLRDMDADGTLGFRDMSDDRLSRAVTALHGVPRALELLAGIRQRDLFRELEAVIQDFYLSDDVLESLVNESFKRLNKNELLVMHALTVMSRPAKLHEIAFLVDPSAPGLAVDAVLSGLIRSRMVAFDRTNRLFSINEIERDYCMAHFAKEDNAARVLLERRAADYYGSLLTDPESWRTALDFEPHLARCEHLVKAGDISAACEGLADMDLEFAVRTGAAPRILRLQERLAVAVDEPLGRAAFLLGLGLVHCFVGPLESALDNLKQARQAAASLGKVELERRAIGWLGETQRRLGQLDAAIEHLEQACAIYTQADTPMRDRFPLMLSLAYAYHGHAANAGKWAERMRTIAERFDQMELHEGHIADALSLSCVVEGRYADAIAHTEVAMQAYKRIEAYDPIAYVLNVWGLALMGLGSVDEALARFAQAIDTARNHTVPRAQGIAALNQARALWQQGDRKTAIKAAATAADVLASIGSSESAAADALQEAVATAGEPLSRQHLEALLVCARATAGNGDLFPPIDLATAVRDGAERAGIDDLKAQAEAILKDLAPVKE